jgi:hypothetical protein
VENHVFFPWFSTLTLSEILQVSRFDNQKTSFNLNAKFSNLNQPIRCGNNNIFAALPTGWQAYFQYMISFENLPWHCRA